MVENTIKLFKQYFRGKYAHVKTSADDFAKTKQDDMTAEIVADQERIDEERAGNNLKKEAGR